MWWVYLAVSGDTVAIVDEYEGMSAKEMNQSVAAQIGVPRFRQRFLSEEGFQEIWDDEVFTAQRVKVQLLLSELGPPESREDEQMIFACRDNDSMVLEELLQRPPNPNLTADGITLLRHAAANGQNEPTQLLLEAGAFRMPGAQEIKRSRRCSWQQIMAIPTLLDCWLIAVRTDARPESMMKQHRCTSLLRNGIGKFFNCWSRLGLRSTKPRLKAQHPRTLQSRMHIWKLFMFWLGLVQI